MTGGSAERVRWGHWGEAVLLAFRYTHPRTGANVEIRQAVRVPRDLPFDLTIGERQEIVELRLPGIDDDQLHAGGQQIAREVQNGCGLGA